jgi:hypothetical protein
VQVGAKVIVLPQTHTAQRKPQPVQPQVSYAAPVSMQASNVIRPSGLY